jgi:hypothetical protein
VLDAVVVAELTAHVLSAEAVASSTYTLWDLLWNR